MRISISLVLVLAVVGCTKHNPLVCCTDPADCMANNIPVGSTCADGLLCRGNQCVAETCSSATDCDTSAPYCAAGSCTMSCTDDTQCPGNGEPAGDLFCVSGTCVACRVGMNDCPANAPVCDMNACRACTLDSECASNVCDVDSGACVAESSIRYAAPNGSDTADCSQTTPCTLSRALSLVDASHATVRMLPGNYAGTTTAMVSGQTVEIDGTGATLPAYVNVGNGANVTIRGLDYTGTACGNLDVVVLRQATLRDLRVASGCKASLSESTIGMGASGQELFIENDANVNIDRTLVTLASPSTVISPGHGLTLHVTNSVFFESELFIALGSPATGQAFDVYVAHNTFYVEPNYGPAALICPQSTVTGVIPGRIVVVNNVLVAPGSANALVATSNCTADTNVSFPEAMGSDAGTNPIIKDPLFVDGPNGNFHLQVASPAKDAAKLITPEPTVDFDGTTRPQGAGYDIGAFEYH